MVIIDDDDQTLRLATLILTSHGFAVEAYRNPAAALAAVSARRPGAVVLDLVMPVMNGMEAAYEISRIAPNAKIVFISSHYTPEQTTAMARLFGADFVQKSEVAKELIPTINRLLDV